MAEVKAYVVLNDKYKDSHGKSFYDIDGPFHAFVTPLAASASGFLEYVPIHLWEVELFYPSGDFSMEWDGKLESSSVSLIRELPLELITGTNVIRHRGRGTYSKYIYHYQNGRIDMRGSDPNMVIYEVTRFPEGYQSSITLIYPQRHPSGDGHMNSMWSYIPRLQQIIPLTDTTPSRCPPEIQKQIMDMIEEAKGL